VVTACTLGFGGLLLPAGRLADLLGRNVTFLTGAAGFGFSPTDNLVAYITSDEGSGT
jgi:MFS family permease